MLIGRKKELDILNKAVQDEYSHFIAVYGRRRIGKTFLIREAFGYRFTFQHSGLSEGGLQEQIFAFESSIKDAGLEVKKKRKNWLEAFEDLKDVIRASTEKKKVIFIDELSWMDTQNSDLLVALENFWNGWASARKDVVLIVCASATSWMISKVIHNKGGLYNRLTEQIHLEQFTLAECEECVKANGIVFTRNQILQCYMIFGGIPYYWGFLQRGLSLQQNIDAIFFAKNAPLKDEYKYLYASIYKNPTVHQKIIETLGKKKVGMTREEIIEGSGLINSGDLTVKLEELESCGFIRKYYSFGMKKKNAVYQLIDNFTLFYHQFISREPNDEHFWSNQINTPAVNTWQGLAFERVCLEHIDQIKKKLGISGVYTDINSWYCKKDDSKGIRGAQIDLLIVRKDQVINMCEMKYSNSEYTISEADDTNMRNKIVSFSEVTKTKYAIYPTLITVYGLVENAYAGNIQSVVTVDDLFG
ncbi:AAA family ATPase [Butyrivibrio fibrisolvens]|uniref:AAA family ATPase n=1 Tax=Butyrivibrio fibrisolvens TaxID=831 RepID=UPI0003B46640|nr:ATP-binding protein [Butyrivibrio fibrisolvens]